jgi:hypothetical protein
VKPLFSEEEKTQAVRTFLIALQQKKAKITSYLDIRDRIDSGRVSVLCHLNKGGHDAYGLNPYYTNGDAQVYFEWLVSAVSGTLPDAIGDDLIKRANDQLFRFIEVMQQSGNVEIDSKIQMIEPYDWQNLFSSFDERLTNMQRIIDKGDKDIIEVLKPLLQLMKENKTLLKKLLRESEKPFGR